MSNFSAAIFPLISNPFSIKSVCFHFRSAKVTCDYCPKEFPTKSLLVEHIKDAHNDLIFHCEMCDDYVARVELISHMLNHALNSNNIIKESTEAVEIKSPEEPETDKNASKNSPAKKTATPEKQRKESTTANGNPKTTKSQRYCELCKKTFADSGTYRKNFQN